LSNEFGIMWHRWDTFFRHATHTPQSPLEVLEERFIFRFEEAVFFV
jgi:hypothetical protein